MKRPRKNTNTSSWPLPCVFTALCNCAHNKWAHNLMLPFLRVRLNRLFVCLVHLISDAAVPSILLSFHWTFPCLDVWSWVSLLCKYYCQCRWLIFFLLMLVWSLFSGAGFASRSTLSHLIALVALVFPVYFRAALVGWLPNSVYYVLPLNLMVSNRAGRKILTDFFFFF